MTLRLGRVRICSSEPPDVLVINISLAQVTECHYVDAGLLAFPHTRRSDYLLMLCVRFRWYRKRQLERGLTCSHAMIRGAGGLIAEL